MAESNNKKEYNVVAGENFTGVIFPADVDISYLFRDYGRWEPDQSQVFTAESLVREYLQQLAGNAATIQRDARIKKVYEELNRYKRQYFGLIDKQGDKIIWINFFLPEFSDWKEKIVDVMDGGASFFNIKVNLKTGKCFNLYINGEA